MTDIAVGILTGNLPLVSSIGTSCTMSELEDEAVYVDYAREFKDISTDIVVKHFLSSPDCMFNFLTIIFDVFYTELRTYKEARGLVSDIAFVYKGGNVLRIVANDFKSGLPEMAGVQEHFRQFFKASDSDFSIYIRPTIQNYDKVFEEVTSIAYYVQVYLRRMFCEDPTKYFDFFRYSKEYQESILKNYYERIQESSAFTNPANKLYYNESITSLTFDLAGYPLNKPFGAESDKRISLTTPNIICVQELNNSNKYMYILDNEGLDFKTDAINRVKFTLVRTKMNFNYYFKGKRVENIGGELIDVSIPRRLDTKLEHFFSEVKIVKYELKYNDEKILFLGYSVPGLRYDLETILFGQRNFPWEDMKYKKRMSRLMYFYFIELFYRQYNKKKFLKELTAVTSLRLPDDKAALIATLKKPLFCVNNLGKFLLQVVSRIKSDDDIQQFNNMMEQLSVDVSVLTKGLDAVTDFCNKKSSLKDLYSANISALV